MGSACELSMFARTGAAILRPSAVLPHLPWNRGRAASSLTNPGWMARAVSGWGAQRRDALLSFRPATACFDAAPAALRSARTATGAIGHRSCSPRASPVGCDELRELRRLSRTRACGMCREVRSGAIRCAHCALRLRASTPRLRRCAQHERLLGRLAADPVRLERRRLGAMSCANCAGSCASGAIRCALYALRSVALRSASNNVPTPRLP
jgi:hypothetical protein